MPNIKNPQPISRLGIFIIIILGLFDINFKICSSFQKQIIYIFKISEALLQRMLNSPHNSLMRFTSFPKTKIS